MNQRKKEFHINESVLTTILFWCGLVIVSSNYITIPLMPILSQNFHAPISQVAWSGTIFSLFYAFGCLFTGPLSERFGKKTVMVIGLFLLAIATEILPLGTSLLWLMIWRGLEGLAAASFAPVVVAYIIDKFQPQKRGTIIGIVSSSFLVAAIIGQIMSSYLSQHFQWQTVFFVFGILYILTAILMLLFVPNTPVTQKTSNLKSMFSDFFQLFFSKNLFKIYMIAIVLLMIFVAFYSVLGEYLTEKFALTNSEIFNVRAIGIIGMLLAPFSGQLANRFKIDRLLKFALGSALIGSIMVAVSPNYYLLVTMSVIFVGGIALTVPTLISLVGQLGGEKHSLAVSLYTFILFIGAGLGPLLAVQLSKIENYTISLLILAFLLAIAWLISLTIHTSKAH
ncbi:MAG: MFS transporter [Streptococcaceae bacterium]|nr:MFS transporter [Streptococcaceae bacterium]